MKLGAGEGGVSYPKLHVWLHLLSTIVHIATCVCVVYAAISVAHDVSRIEDGAVKSAANIVARVGDYLRHEHDSPRSNIVPHDGSRVRCSGFLGAWSGSDMAGLLRHLSKALDTASHINVTYVNQMVERASSAEFFGDIHRFSGFSGAAAHLIQRVGSSWGGGDADTAGEGG